MRVDPGGGRIMSERVGGYADPGTGGLVSGYTGTKPGGDKAKAIIKGIKPGG